jgi:hypothetical protein
MTSHPSAFGNYLCALDYLLSSPREIAIAGDPRSDETRALLREIFSRYLPNKVVACGTRPDPPLLENRGPVDGMPAAYVCRDHICEAPVTTLEELSAKLGQR